MRTARWIIFGLLAIFALIMAYVWSIQPVAPAEPPPGWQTFKQGPLTVVLPPEFIVLDPNQPDANQHFTQTYSGTHESLEKISTSPAKIEFLAVNLENGDIVMLIDEANQQSESTLLKQIDNVAELLFRIREHNIMDTESFSRTGSISVNDTLIAYFISEKSQMLQSNDAFELIRLQIKVEKE
ncbi:hypothetical protein [Herpetosiphon llansteffanensis]|uniref:hypothetical protein n=1 Tax=Herpetosiphon llansteffanensis TaxID=2094568 RepID=UPI000D7D10B0|nr:hypothetical protein [Herpetosiphon llansteffanensis]